MRQFDLLNMDTLQSSNLIDEGDHYVIEVDGQGRGGYFPAWSWLNTTRKRAFSEPVGSWSNPFYFFTIKK